MPTKAFTHSPGSEEELLQACSAYELFGFVIYGGRKASAQSPTHSDALKTASSDAQKASAPTPSAAGVTPQSLVEGQTAHSKELRTKMRKVTLSRRQEEIEL